MTVTDIDLLAIYLEACPESCEVTGADGAIALHELCKNPSISMLHLQVYFKVPPPQFVYLFSFSLIGYVPYEQLSI